MLAPSRLPWRYRVWNARWGAPFGYRRTVRLSNLLSNQRWRDRIRGPFSHQPNNTTRLYEYPWVAEQVCPRPGLRVLEIGGGLSGLQFVFSRLGCDVTNVDPGVDTFGRDWDLSPKRFEELNGAYGTNVRLIRDQLENADLDRGSFDAVVSVSVIEHMGSECGRAVLSRAAELLRPGGRIVLTLDLFPDLFPFGLAEKNSYGTNVDVKEIVEGFKIVVGKREELLGFPEFDAAEIMRKQADFLVGATPAWSQCMTLVKEAVGMKGVPPS